jgi:hypothetical protein
VGEKFLKSRFIKRSPSRVDRLVGHHLIAAIKPQIMAPAKPLPKLKPRDSVLSHPAGSSLPNG